MSIWDIGLAMIVGWLCAALQDISGRWNLTLAGIAICVCSYIAGKIA